MAVPIDESRIERLLQVLVNAAAGNYDVRVELEEHDDPFLEVELGVNYLLDELVERRQQNRAQREEIAAHARQLAEQQSELVQALSTPVIVVWPGVLALPIVGRVDDERAATITATLLERVTRERASHVIIDLTGVGTIAAATMPAILRMVRAIGLLGATCLLTGIRPEVARQIVGFGGEESRVRSLAQLSDALALVLAEKRVLGR
ncbi:MAG TPA: STAS domain-containing protein [Nannocystis sp.]